MRESMILCDLSPSAVTLLELLKNRHIRFRRHNALNGTTTNGNKVLLAGALAEPTEVTKRKYRVSGKRTVKGVTYKSYRPGQLPMSKHAVLTTGKKYKAVRGDNRMPEYLAAIKKSMVEFDGVMQTPRSDAIDAVQAIRKDLTRGQASTVVSRLYRVGALRMVL